MRSNSLKNSGKGTVVRMDRLIKELLVHHAKSQSGVPAPLIKLYMKMFGVPIIGFRTRFSMVKKLTDRMDLRGKKVLDIGCGRGAFSLMLSDRCQVLGIDLQNERITEVKRIAEKFGLNARFEAGDIFNIYKMHRGYDGMICIELIEHVRDDKGLLGKLNSMLKKDGFLILTTPSIDRRVHQAIEEQPGGHVRTGYSPDGITALLDKSGFDTESISFMDPFNIHYIHAFTFSTKKRKYTLFAYLLFPFTYALIWLTSLIFKNNGSMLFIKARKRSDI